MSLRAEKERTHDRRAGAPPAVPFSALVLVLPLVLLLSSASSLRAQRSVTARAVVHVPTISELDVAPLSTSLPSSSASNGMLRIRVTANHPWKLLVAVPAGLDGPILVQVMGDGASDTYRRLEPGSEVALATGAQGATELRVAYRWEGDPTTAGLPIQATLATASF